MIEKNATIRSIRAIQRSTKPTTIMVKTAPIRVNSPTVPNMFTPVFSESVVNDFLRKMAVTTPNTKSTIRPPTIAAI